MIRLQHAVNILFTPFRRKFKHEKPKGFSKNLFFYFGLVSFVLLGVLFSNSDSLAKLSYLKNSDAAFFNSFFKNADSQQVANDLFFYQNGALALETPDLKLIQDDFIYAISTPRVLTTQTLGSILGGPNQNSDKKDVVDYTVQPGDTIQSVAQSFDVSTNTVIWANDLSKNATLKTGQSLVILPVSGVIHIVKPGDTIGEISKKYKSNVNDTVSFNSLTDEGDIFIGDILIVPGGIMPEKILRSNNQIALPDSFFIYPAEGQISQGLHYYNGIDIANKCGTSVYAAAAGVVQRAVANNKWNLGMGNHVSILHANNVSTYYGHLLALFVKPGDQVNVGDRIGLMGKTGNATGCHVHFQVMGAANPLVKYRVGTLIKY